MPKKQTEETVNIRCNRTTHRLLQILKGLWYVSQEKALERAVREALEREGIEVRGEVPE